VIREPLGLESGVVYLRPFDEAWAELYRAEIDRIEPILSGNGVRLEFHHTGSTSISAMPAKPIIDILAGLSGAGDRQKAIDALQLAGYVHRGEQGIEGRDFFRRGHRDMSIGPGRLDRADGGHAHDGIAQPVTRAN